jgi:hypothetical protein
MPLVNRSTGDGAECDDVGVGVGAVDDVDGAAILRLANDAKRLVYFGVTAKLVKLILGYITPIITNWVTNLITVMNKVDKGLDETNLPLLKTICCRVSGVGAQVG